MRCLISAAPADGRDPVLAAFGDDIARAQRLRSVVYLSTLGVYGDSGGAWIDETTPVVSADARRGHARIDAERAWQALGARREMPVDDPAARRHLWPRTERMVRLLRGTAHRIAKPGHVFEPHPRLRHRAGDRRSFRAASRRQCSTSSMTSRPRPAIKSHLRRVCSGSSHRRKFPMRRLASLLSPLALSFYEGCIRARNDKLKTVLGVKLRYPTYRDGLQALYRAGDHLAVPAPAAPA